MKHFAVVASLVFVISLSGRNFAKAQGRKQIVLGAAELALPEQRADQLMAGKWWLKRDAMDWGSPDGNVLFTGWPAGMEKPYKPGFQRVPPADRFTATRVPDLTIDPKANGWYRIYVGLYRDESSPFTKLHGRLSREPYPEFLQASQDAKGKIAETYWKMADLTGQKIILSQPLGPMPHPGSGYVGGISHIRLVPVTDAEVTAAKREIELPPPELRPFGIYDASDNLFWYASFDTEDDIRAIVYQHAQAGFGRVYWRAFGTHLENTFALPEAAPRWTEADEKKWAKNQGSQAGWQPWLDRVKKFDPLKTAVEYGKQSGCEIYAYVRFSNFNRVPLANFYHDHPEFRSHVVLTEEDPKTKRQVPKKPYQYAPTLNLSLAHPEVRAFYVKFFKEIARTGTKGILIDLLRHPGIAGYEPISRDAFKKKHGHDMETHELYYDPLVQEHLSQYLHAFLVDVRKELGKEVQLIVRCAGPRNFAFRGKEWVAEGLVDGILDGNWYSGSGPRSTIGDTVTACGDRALPYAVIEPGDVDPTKNWTPRAGIARPDTLLAFARHYSGRGVAGFGLYSSGDFTWYPDIRRGLRAAAWVFEPGKMRK
jgi:hypothetical protein